MVTHEEATELLAAFALDAVDDDERRRIEAHLEECPRCSAELTAYLDVAAALGNCVEPLPEGLWSGISSLLSMPDEEAVPSPPRLVISDGEASRLKAAAPRSGPSRRYLMVVTSVAAAAVAVACVLGVSLARSSDQNSRLQAQVGSSSSSVVAAFETPGHRVVQLESPHHVDVAKFVVVPSGRGYLYSSALPKLHTGTYQLWGVIDGQAISLGLLGRSPSQATFTVAGSPAPSQLGITVEPDGGSVVPSSTMLASGTY